MVLPRLKAAREERKAGVLRVALVAAVDSVSGFLFLDPRNLVVPRSSYFEVLSTIGFVE